MEVLELPGYTEEEKLKIAIEHLIAKQVKNHGLTPEHIEFNEAAMRDGHPRLHPRSGRAQPRARDRRALPQGRAPARRRRRGQGRSITPDVVAEMLGAPTFLDEEMEKRTKDPGVAVGLAWTPAGGEVLFVEASRMQGGGSLTLTGQLGDVMKESARTALSWFRAHAPHYGVDPAFYKDSEIHLHVPSGAIPKDGPSAGVTMVTALASRADRPSGAWRHRDDGRDHALGPRVAGRRHQGKGAGRAASRHPRGHPAAAEREERQ